MNLCSGCNRDFTSITAFEKHRIGSHSKNTRRCMTEQEMTRAGLEHKASGKWGMIADDWKRARIAQYREEEASHNAILASGVTR